MNDNWTRIALLLGGIFLTLTAVAAQYEGVLPWNPIQPDSASYLKLANGMAETGMFTLDGQTPSAARELLYPAFLSFSSRWD